jgi:hypothetical protein
MVTGFDTGGTEFGWIRDGWRRNGSGVKYVDDIQLSIILQLRFCTCMCVSWGGWYMYGWAGNTTTPFQHAATSTGFSFLIRSIEI